LERGAFFVLEKKTTTKMEDALCLLGLEYVDRFDASKIGRVYRRVALRVHPDKNMWSERQATIAMQNLNNARDLLVQYASMAGVADAPSR
jgi:hypothetical protein